MDIQNNNVMELCVMKKILLPILFLIFANFLFAQEAKQKLNYTDGYEDLVWGTTIEKASDKYPSLQKEYSAECMSGEECYSVYTGTVERIFRFYNNKLYWVRVVYDGISQTQFDALCDKLIEKYGSLFFDMDSDDKIKFGYQWMLFTDMNVQLTVNNKINAFGAKLGEWCGVIYSCPSITKEMQKAESENIEL